MRGPAPEGDADVVGIPVELETVPGAPQDRDTVNFYTTHYPLESHSVENFVYRKWSRDVSDIKEVRDEHERLNKPHHQGVCGIGGDRADRGAGAREGCDRRDQGQGPGVGLRHGGHNRLR